MIARQVAAAMSLAGALMIGIQFSGSSDNLIVPLLAEAATFRDLGGLWVLKAVLFAGFFYLGLKPAVLLFGAITTTISWLAFYSSTGAFVPQVILNCLFMALILNPNMKDSTVRSLAILFTSSFFLIAGLQKINSLYLSGIEFQSQAGFAAYYLYFFKPLPLAVSRDILPALSIAVELCIGIGLLYRPNIFANLATVFILCLMYVHPTLALPYLTFAATACLIDPELATSLQRRLGKIPVASALTWFAVLLAFQSLRKIGDKSALEFFWLPAAFATIFIAIHVSHIARHIQNPDWASHSIQFFPLRGPPQNRLAILLIAGMLGLPALHALGAPSPLGFSMFSANTTTLRPARAKEMPSLQIGDWASCETLAKNLVRLIVTDVTLRQTGNQCGLVAPTRSGLKDIRERLCKINPESCTALLIIDPTSQARGPLRPEIPE